MKRIFIALLCVVMLVMCVACGHGKNTDGFTIDDIKIKTQFADYKWYDGQMWKIYRYDNGFGLYPAGEYPTSIFFAGISEFALLRCRLVDRDEIGFTKVTSEPSKPDWFSILNEESQPEGTPNFDFSTSLLWGDADMKPDTAIYTMDIELGGERTYTIALIDPREANIETDYIIVVDSIMAYRHAEDNEEPGISLVRIIRDVLKVN